MPSQEEPRYADDELLREDEDIVARPARGGAPSLRGWGTPWAVLLIFLLVGVGLGVYAAGLGGPGVQQGAAPTPASVPTGVAPSDRIAELRAAIAADPEDVDARLELGVLLWSLETPDLNGARDQWLAVTVIDPKNVNAWYDLGFYYLSLDPPDATKAKAAWDNVVKLDPNGELADLVEDHMAGLFAGASPSATPTKG